MSNNVVELIVDLKVEGKKDLAKYSRELKQLSKIMKDIDKQNKKALSTSQQLQTQQKNSNKETTKQVQSNKKLVNSQKDLISNNSKIVSSTKSQVKAQKELSKILKEVANESKNASESTSKMGGSFSVSKIGKFAKGLGGVVTVLGQVSAAAVAVGSAISTMVINSAKSVRELENLSRQARLSKLDFEALSFATEQFGITQEQIADISKDLYDKLGDSVTNAAGPFHEFGNALGLTKEQTRELAREFQNLTSPQIITRMVKMLEEAGVSGAQMTQVLEAMGNDLSKLEPLFRSNAKELQNLSNQYKKVNEDLQLTEEQSKNLLGAAVNFDLFTKSAKAGSDVISAELAPAVSKFFEELTKTVPVITKQLAMMIQSFREINEITNFDTLNNEAKKSRIEIKEMESDLVKLQEKLEKQQKSSGFSSNYDNANMTQIKINALQKKLNDERSKLVDIDERIKDLRQEEVKANKEALEIEKQKTAEQEKQGKLNGTAGDSTDLRALQDRFKTEEQLLKEKYEKDLKLAADNEVLKLQIANEYYKKYGEILKQRADDEIAENQRVISESLRELEAQKAVIQLEFDVGNISEDEFKSQMTEVAKKQIEEINKLNASDLEKRKEILTVERDLAKITKSKKEYTEETFETSQNLSSVEELMLQANEKIAASKREIANLTNEAKESSKELAAIEKKRLEEEEASLERMKDLRSQLLELDSTKSDVDILESQRKGAVDDINSREYLSDESKQQEIDLTNLIFDEQKIDAQFEAYKQRYFQLLQELEDANPVEAGEITNDISNTLTEMGNIEGLDASQMNELTKATNEWNESLNGASITLNTVANELSSGLTQAIGSVIDGTKSIDEAFSDMALSIIQNLIEVQMQMMIMQALGLNSQGGFTGGGLFGMIGGAMGGMGGGFSMPFFHNGGDVDSPMVDTRQARSPNSDEMLAMVKKNETIMTKNQKNDLMANGGSSNPNVNINNNLVLDPADLQKSIGKTDEFSEDVLAIISANKGQIQDIVS